MNAIKEPGMVQKMKLAAAAPESLGKTAKAIVLMKPTAAVMIPTKAQSKRPICVKPSKKRHVQITWSTDRNIEAKAIQDTFKGLVLV